MLLPVLKRYYFHGLTRCRRAFEAHSFPATILDSPAAARLQLDGPCWLRITAQELAVLDPGTWEVLCAWPFHHIHHYGRNRGVFTFEAGELAGSTRGVFYLASDCCNDMFRLMKELSVATVRQGQISDPHASQSMPVDGYGQGHGRGQGDGWYAVA